MNFNELIQWALKRWWWFAVSVVVCLMVGGIYYVFKAPVFNVEAVLMLRQSESSNQDEMLQMMGFGGNKITGDEVRVLTSRDLLGRVVDSLDLCTTYAKKGKRFSTIQYPEHDLSVQLMAEQVMNVDVTVKVKKSGYKIAVKRQRHTERLTVTALDTPIHTFVGDIHIALADTITKGTYTAHIEPRFGAVEGLLKQLRVNRLARESNIITLSTASTCPKRAIDAINTLLDLYNLETATDKNRIAIQTEQFLTARLNVVTNELEQIEAEIETYKRQQQIADLDRSASSYQKSGEEYELMVAEMDAELNMMDLLEKQLLDPNNRFCMIPGNVGISDNTLNTMIQDYNSQIIHRNALLQTATEQNPIVELTSDQIDQKRASILSGISQSRKTITMRRQFILNQQHQYDNRLASIPETERRYLELQRSKQATEKQYVYLIEKREENAMLLASEAVPAKIVDRAQRNPKPIAPQMKTIVAASVLMGLLLPLCLFFLGLIRKQYHL